MMQNISIRREGDKLIITADLSKEIGLSSSGKSMLLATTGGNVSIEDNSPIKIGLTIYKSTK